MPSFRSLPYRVDDDGRGEALPGVVRLRGGVALLVRDDDVVVHAKHVELAQPAAGVSFFVFIDDAVRIVGPTS